MIQKCQIPGILNGALVGGIYIGILYLISTVFIISRAENYEWTVINNSDVIETNSQAEGENADKTTKDELNLECESAILIEQNSGQVLYEKNSHEQLGSLTLFKYKNRCKHYECLFFLSNFQFSLAYFLVLCYNRLIKK